MPESETEGPRVLRCAIYTRKSTEEGLEQSFNTLDAQREASEAYIQSQRQNGWELIHERFDDGGFSGANLERPALKRLLESIDAGAVDVVVVYKLDRLTRSLLDFAKLMERFDRRGVSFVSITQQFNTSTSLGRLTLSLLTLFAQYERELISERTRDKLSAARRKGKWIGGWPVLGYDVHPRGSLLVVNAKEAAQVREMYRIAAEVESLEGALGAINELGFKTKAWTSRSGKRHVAAPFSKMTLRLLLSNVLYTGQVNHKGTLYAGEQDRIVEQEVWERVNQQLALRSMHQRGRTHRKEEAPLSGWLRCAACESPMSISHTTKGGKRYRYYGCQKCGEEKNGSQRPLAAVDIENSVLQNLKPVLGFNLSWSNIRNAVSGIQYEPITRRVMIEMREGTQFDYAMAAPSRRGAKGGIRESAEGRLPRVSRLLALAIKFEERIRQGDIRNQRAIADAGHVSRARLSQIMRLTDLAPAIQEELLFLPKIVAGPDRITERQLRDVGRSIDWEQQRQRFEELKRTYSFR